jgi:hypothetical protein
VKPPTTFISAGLVAAVKAATAECTEAMNEQFLALVAGDPDTARFDAKIAQAVEKRKLAMAYLMDHVRLYGW